MKKTLLIAFLISNICAMSQGKIFLKNKPFKYNKVNTFIYIPPKDVFVPEFSNVKCRSVKKLEYVPLVKLNGHYEFIYKCSEETKIACFEIINCNSKPVEKNYEQDYFFNCTAKPDNSAEVLSQKLNLIGNLKSDYIKLKISDAEFKNQFEELFKKYPTYKDSLLRCDYLQLCTKLEPEKYKSDFEEYLQQQINKGDEKSLINAIYGYSIMKEYDKSNEILKILSEKFPHSNKVAESAVIGFWMKPNRTEAECDSFINYFKTTFPDNKIDLETSYYFMCTNFIRNNNFDLAIQSTNHINDKVKVNNMYNFLAAQTLNKDNPTKNDLEIAEKYFQKSVELMKDTMSHVDKYDRAVIQAMYNYRLNKYAKVQTQLGNYERAFEIQDSLRKCYGLDELGQINYALCLEKLKGLKPVKEYYDYLVKQHVATDTTLKAMKEVYQKLKLSTAAITKIEADRKLEFEKIEKSDIIKRFGNFKSRNFKLKDMQGNEVELAKLKGKVVVMDFWATWCPPCIASLPHMQMLADKYKNKDIVFYCINTREKGTPDIIYQKVKKFLDDKKYTLNVLFDTGDKVSRLYAVQGIPQTFVIDKNGNIACMLQPTDLTEEMIEKALK